MIDALYLMVITAGLCAAYVALIFFFPFFFQIKSSKVSKRSIVRSLFALILLSIAGYAVAFSIPDLELGNRVLHGFGGGFMAFFACFLAAKDSRLPIDRVRFFILCALIVTALGVANELAELFLERCCGLPLPETLDDTWLDLMSNTVGLLLASACFVPFSGQKSRD